MEYWGLFIKKLAKRLNKKMEEKFRELEKKIGVEFESKSLLIQAFCHRSYLNENPNFDLGHNERLEFLGDAVLELVVTNFLYLQYPENSEGELTSWRASLVNTKELADTAEGLSFQDYLLLSKGENRENGRARLCILANTFESFIGALYLDKGYEVVEKFIQENLIVKLDRIIELGLYRDPKSELQERTQEDVGITPNYNVLEESGPDHQKHFKIGVFLNEELVGEGEGWSKKEAEEEAAKDALNKNNWKNN
jgi:ribonuclease III